MQFRCVIARKPRDLRGEGDPTCPKRGAGRGIFPGNRATSVGRGGETSMISITQRNCTPCSTVAGGFLLCACSGDSGDSNGSSNGFVIVTLNGEADAFADRTINVNGVEFPPASLSTYESRVYGAPVMTTEVGLCTRSREAFLSAPLFIEVIDASGTVVTGPIERIGCAASPDLEKEHLDVESNYLWLNLDGTVNADFGSIDTFVYAVCETSGYEPVCDTEQLDP